MTIQATMNSMSVKRLLFFIRDSFPLLPELFALLWRRTHTSGSTFVARQYPTRDERNKCQQQPAARQSLTSERYHRINLRRSSRRYPASQQRHARKRQRNQDERQRVGGG